MLLIRSLFQNVHNGGESCNIDGNVADKGVGDEFNNDHYYDYCDVVLVETKW